MQGEFCHFGRETTQCDAGITGGIDETWLVQVGSFLREFWVLRRGAGGGGWHFFRGSRGDTRAVRHECWDALATVGASGLVSGWLTSACRGDFFHGKPR